MKHYEDCEQLFMSIGRCYLVEALLDFFGMTTVDDTPEKNNAFLSSTASCEETKNHLEATLERFVAQYIVPDMSLDNGDQNYEDGVLNYSINLLKSFMILLDYKDAVASGNGEHLALLHKQLIPYFFSVSYNSYAIEMLVSTMQNEVTLSPAEAHQCKWAALANWKGGKNKNIEIDILQENRNRDLKELNKSILFNPLHKLNEKKFSEWLKKHQKNLSLHFPVMEPEDFQSDEDIEELDC